MLEKTNARRNLGTHSSQELPTGLNSVLYRLSVHIYGYLHDLLNAAITLLQIPDSLCPSAAKVHSFLPCAVTYPSLMHLHSSSLRRQATQIIALFPTLLPDSVTRDFKTP
jgi:hypothetical protein